MNLLTFDIEEWFHILDHANAPSVSKWHALESRVEEMTMLILEVLGEADVKATFFIVGWIAKTYPGLVKKIFESGHHVGSHSSMHKLAYTQDPYEFESDLRQSLDEITSITGVGVDAYRAPGFSIKRDNLHYLSILAQAGIKYDCSLFTAKRAHGGLSEFNQPKPFLIKTDQGILKEFPISYFDFALLRIVFSGGGYFRICPLFLLKALIKNSTYNMVYLHPRDFDVNQPKLEGLSFVRSFKHYVGISDTAEKLDNILPLNFMSVAAADKKIDWKSVELINV